MIGLKSAVKWVSFERQMARQLQLQLIPFTLGSRKGKEPVPMYRSLLRAGVVAVLTLLGLGTGTVRADVVISPMPVSVTPVAGGFQYDYSVSLTSLSTLNSSGGGANSNNGFIFYDARGLKSGSVSFSSLVGPVFGAPIVSNTTTAFPGTTPVPADNPAIPNIQVLFTGASPLANPSLFLDLPLGNLIFTSIFGQTLGSNPVSATSGASQSGVDGTLIKNNVGQTTGPNPSVPTPGIPEPATFALLGFGMAVVGLGYRFRRKVRTVTAAA
jgi:hypothetical protein